MEQQQQQSEDQQQQLGFTCSDSDEHAPLPENSQPEPKIAPASDLDQTVEGLELNDVTKELQKSMELKDETTEFQKTSN
jgi:hypothetical protein